MTTFHVAVEFSTALRNRFELRLAEEGAVGAVDPVLAGLRDGLVEGGNERRKQVAGALRRRRRQVRRARLRVVTGAVRRCLGAPERALVEEEQLQVLAPAEAPVDAALVAEGDRHVVAERPHAAVVERAPVLGNREVVDELVVVPVVVEPGRGADPLHVLDRELLPVHGPLLPHPESGGRARDLRVGVDRVAEVDVEVVVLGHHRVWKALKFPQNGLASPGACSRSRRPSTRT